MTWKKFNPPLSPQKLSRSNLRNWTSTVSLKYSFCIVGAGAGAFSGFSSSPASRCTQGPPSFKIPWIRNALVALLQRVLQLFFSLIPAMFTLQLSSFKVKPCPMYSLGENQILLSFLRRLDTLYELLCFSDQTTAGACRPVHSEQNNWIKIYPTKVPVINETERRPPLPL